MHNSSKAGTLNEQTLKRLENKENITHSELVFLVASHLQKIVFPKIQEEMSQISNQINNGNKLQYTWSKKERNIAFANFEEQRDYLELAYEIEHNTENGEILSSLNFELSRVELEQQHTLKTRESIEKKSSKIPVLQMTDLIRGTIIFENQPSESELLQYLSGIFNVFANEKFTFNGQACSWFITSNHTDPKYRKSGYSDLSLIFGSKIPTSGEIIFFELQINTKDFVRQKALETPLYNQKKDLLEYINYTLSGVGDYLGNVPYKSIEIEDLDKMFESLENSGHITENGFLKEKKGFEVISAIFKNSFHITDLRNSPNPQAIRYLTSLCSKIENNIYLYSSMFELLNTFIQSWYKTKSLYANLNGIISSREKAIGLKHKILTLASIQPLLNTNTGRIKRIHKKSTPRQPLARQT
jgi:hypothetical protein